MKGHPDEGAVFVELAVGLTVLFMLVGGVLLFAQSIKEANVVLDASRYAARLGAAPLVAQTDPGAGDTMFVQGFTASGSALSSKATIEAQAVDLARKYIQDEGSLKNEQFGVSAHVEPVVEDAETFWIVKVDITRNDPNRSYFKAFFSGEVSVTSRSAYLVQSVPQGA